MILVYQMAHLNPKSLEIIFSGLEIHVPHSSSSVSEDCMVTCKAAVFWAGCKDADYDSSRYKWGEQILFWVAPVVVVL